MRTETFRHRASDGHELHVYRWLPDDDALAHKPRAVIQIVHGLVEHAARYAATAEAMTAAGFVVYADDHRGHGHTAGPDELGFFAERDGWRRVVDDKLELSARIRDAFPGTPQLLLGHSMGSFLCQMILGERGADYTAVVLSGTADAPPRPLQIAGRLAARVERRRLGPRGRSEVLTKLAFGTYNNGIPKPRHEFAWLSRDAEVVAAYADDPLCGFTATTQLWNDLLGGISEMAEPARRQRIPRDVPIYMFSGERDPVGGWGKSFRQLLAVYAALGLHRVDHKLYPGGRHEMLNELNRDEVIEDLLRWINGVLEHLPGDAGEA